MAEVKQMSALDCAEFLKQNSNCKLYDVRTDGEIAICKIDGSVQLTQENLDEALAGDKDQPIIFQCHHGMRSLNAAQMFLENGFTELYNMSGGIDAWSEQVDQSVERY